jgi:hypothetical protein
MLASRAAEYGGHLLCSCAFGPARLGSLKQAGLGALMWQRLGCAVTIHMLPDPSVNPFPRLIRFLPSEAVCCMCCCAC